MRHLLSIDDLSEKEILNLLSLTQKIKKYPKKFSRKLEQKTLLMVFAKPSLRTRLSFETGMTQLGGHAIYYQLNESTVGKKESVKDFSKTASRYVDIMMARLYQHSEIEEIAKHAGIPVINGLTDFEHPCQALADIFTVREKKGIKKIKFSYIGDGNNNVTHSLLYICSKLGIDISIGCPKNMMPNTNVVNKCKKYAQKKKSSVIITDNAAEAARNSDVIYTDTWMSYQIDENEKEKRESILKPYQINSKLMKETKKAIFMHCLPAARGKEVTDEVMDSKNSIIFDQAENRLHAQKAIMLWLIGKK